MMFGVCSRIEILMVFVKPSIFVVENQMGLLIYRDRIQADGIKLY
jgi:hypothetical protein